MAFHELRDEALKLRKRGKSLNEIAFLLNAKKSTVSYWCRDVALTPRHQARLSRLRLFGGTLGRLRAAEAKKASRRNAEIAAAEMGSADIGHLTTREKFLIGAALYWGEGYKKGNEECGFTNSDPNLIRYFIYWVNRAYGIKPSDLILRVTVNAAYEKSTKRIEKYWSKETRIPIAQFSKPSIVFAQQKRNGYREHTYTGTLRVKVRRATALRRRILGSIAEIARQI